MKLKIYNNLKMNKVLENLYIGDSICALDTNHLDENVTEIE